VKSLEEFRVKERKEGIERKKMEKKNGSRIENTEDDHEVSGRMNRKKESGKQNGLRSENTEDGRKWRDCKGCNCCHK